MRSCAGLTATFMNRLTFVPRTLRSTKWCAAEPGSIVWWVPALRSSASALHRVRDTGSSSLGRDLVERHVLVDPDIAGQTQHALRDDVAQDLVGTAGDAH